MQIAMIASEVAPFSKEGGLADVLGALPAALAGLGQHVYVISPLYRGVQAAAKAAGCPVERVPEGVFTVPIGDADVRGETWRASMPGSEVTVFFLQNDRYYDRDGYYCHAENHSDFQDNSERFIFLSRGALEMCKAIGVKPDVFHCHDWHTGLVPAYLKHAYLSDFPDTATLFTIHNLAYQGIFWHWDMKLTGLPRALFNWKMLEYYGNLSFLKAGLVFADALSTVSRKYSEEIQSEQYGCGMHGVLRERSDALYGIVNGIDTAVWNPETDPLIPAHYSAEDLSGKAECKRALQARLGLAEEPGRPLIGIVSRLVSQKGMDLLEEALPVLLDDHVQFAVLGKGEPHYQEFLQGFHQKHKGLFSLTLGYDAEMAHMIEAGSDMFLMPSRFEPCGMNQLYSQVYGTAPVVRATGGLADTVTDCTGDLLEAGLATGFTFDQYDVGALLHAVQRALKLYQDPQKWRQLARNCMRQDWSWKRSARQYLAVYEELRQRVSG